MGVHDSSFVTQILWCIDHVVLSDMRILLLYRTVQFRFNVQVHITKKPMNPFSHAVIDFAQSIT